MQLEKKSILDNHYKSLEENNQHDPVEIEEEEDEDEMNLNPPDDALRSNPASFLNKQNNNKNNNKNHKNSSSKEDGMKTSLIG